LNIVDYLKKNFFVGNSTFLQKIFSLISILYITNLSNLSTYGNYVIISSIAALLLGCSSFGIGYNYMQKFSSTEFHKKSQLFFSQFFTHFSIIILFVVFFLFFKSHINFFANNDSFSLLFVFYFILLFLSTQLTNYFRYSENFKVYSILLPLPIFLNFIFLSYFYFTEHKIDLYDIMSVMILSLLIQVIISFFLLIRKIKFKFSFLTKKELLFDIKNGLPFRLNFLLTTIVNSSDRYIIMFFLGSKYVGFYSILFTISSFVLMIPSIMTTILQPTLSRLKIENNLTEIKNTVQLSESLFFSLWVPFCVGGIFYINRIVDFFGNETVFVNNQIVFILLALSIFFNGLMIIKGNIYFAFTETQKMLKPIFIASFLNLILNTILIGFYKSILYAALSSLLSYFIGFIIFQYELSRNHAIYFKLQHYHFIILSSMLMILMSILLDSLFLLNTNVLTLVKIVISGVTYFLCLITFLKLFKWKN